MKLRKILAHCRMHFLWPCYFSAGEPGCCAVWYYRTPWGALRAAAKRHAARTLPVPPEDPPVAEYPAPSASGHLRRVPEHPGDRGMYGVIPIGRISQDKP